MFAKSDRSAAPILHYCREVIWLIWFGGLGLFCLAPYRGRQTKICLDQNPKSFWWEVIEAQIFLWESDFHFWIVVFNFPDVRGCLLCDVPHGRLMDLSPLMLKSVWAALKYIQNLSPHFVPPRKQENLWTDRKLNLVSCDKRGFRKSNTSASCEKLGPVESLPTRNIWNILTILL